MLFAKVKTTDGVVTLNAHLIEEMALAPVGAQHRAEITMVNGRSYKVLDLVSWTGAARRGWPRRYFPRGRQRTDWKLRANLAFFLMGRTDARGKENPYETP